MKVTRLLGQEEIEFRRMDLAILFSKIRHLREDRRQYVFAAKRILRTMDAEIEALLRRGEELSRSIDTGIEEGKPAPDSVQGVEVSPSSPLKKAS